MSFMRTLGRLASNFAQSRLENAVGGTPTSVTHHDLRTGETTSETRRTGGLFGATDTDGDGRIDHTERQRDRDAGGLRGENLMGMLGGLGAAVGGAGGLGNFIENVKDHAMEAVGDADEEARAKLLLQAMILAAKADGTIDADERDAILGQIEEDDAEARAFVAEQFASTMSVQDFIATLPDDPAFRAQVYAMSRLAIDVDTPEEEAHMAALAEGLGLSEADIAGM